MDEAKDNRRFYGRLIKKELRTLRHNCKFTYEILYDMSKQSFKEADKQTILLPEMFWLIGFAGFVVAPLSGWCLGWRAMWSWIAVGVTVSSLLLGGIWPYSVIRIEACKYLRYARMYQRLFNDAELFKVSLRNEYCSNTFPGDVVGRFGKLASRKNNIDGSVTTDNDVYNKVNERLATWEKTDIEQDNKDFPDD